MSSRAASSQSSSSVSGVTNSRIARVAALAAGTWEHGGDGGVLAEAP
jgi:hypothetical protein